VKFTNGMANGGQLGSTVVEKSDSTVRDFVAQLFIEPTLFGHLHSKSLDFINKMHHFTLKLLIICNSSKKNLPC